MAASGKATLVEGERVEYWRPCDMPGIEILLAQNCARRWRVYHDTYAICSVLDDFNGVSEWVYRRKINHTKARNLMLMEPGEVHANTRITPPANFRVLLIDPALVQGAAMELGMATSQPHLKLANVADPALFRTFARFHASLESGSSLLERQSRLTACVRAVVERCTEAPPAVALKPSARPALMRARDFIRVHYRSNISLDELARVADVNRFCLVRAFTSEFGLPPHAFQIHLRMERARPLLAARVSPANVAAALGFADQSHFTRHFKRTYGITPGEYLGKKQSITF